MEHKNVFFCFCIMSIIKHMLGSEMYTYRNMYMHCPLIIYFPNYIYVTAFLINKNVQFSFNAFSFSCHTGP